jgi:hypothetical protein
LFVFSTGPTSPANCFEDFSAQENNKKCWPTAWSRAEATIQPKRRYRISQPRRTSTAEPKRNTDVHGCRTRRAFPCGSRPHTSSFRANPQSDGTMKPIGQDGMSQRSIPLAYHGRCCWRQLLPHSVKVQYEVLIEFDDSLFNPPIVCCRLSSERNFQLHFQCNWRPHFIHIALWEIEPWTGRKKPSGRRPEGTSQG